MTLKSWRVAARIVQARTAGCVPARHLWQRPLPPRRTTAPGRKRQFVGRYRMTASRCFSAIQIFGSKRLQRVGFCRSLLIGLIRCAEQLCRDAIGGNRPKRDRKQIRMNGWLTFKTVFQNCLIDPTLISQYSKVSALVPEKPKDLLAPLGDVISTKVRLDEGGRAGDLLRTCHTTVIVREVVPLSALKVKHFVEVVWMPPRDLNADPDENFLPS